MLGITKKYEYQEITVEEISHVYKIASEYNELFKLPRQGRGNPDDERTYLQAFYRGQSDASWQISPSICRNKSVDESISECGELLFEIMAYKQHYIQATRLIDFTTDIDVALYFACNENFDKDGAVFLWLYSPYDPEWTRTKIQCELANIKEERISISEFSEKLFYKYPELKNRYTYKEDFYTELASFLDHGFMIMQPRQPKVENTRIQNQKGCLYACGVKFETPIDNMRTSRNAGDNIFCPHEVVPPEELNKGSCLIKIVIPARIKRNILMKLGEKGITKDTLLPD